MPFLIRPIFFIFLLCVALSVHTEEKNKERHKAAPVVRLTASEQVWLAKHKKIRIAFDGSLPPYSFINETGKYEGIAVDIIKELSQRLGIKFKIYPNASWSKLYRAAGARKIDVVATMVDRPERRMWFNFTQPYLTKSLVIMTREDNATVKNRADLDKKTVALVKGYQYGDMVIRDFPTVKPYYVDTMLSGLRAVINGKADAAVTFMATANYLQAKYLIENLKFADFYDLFFFHRDRTLF